MVRAWMPALSAAAIWLRMSANSGETMTVGPAPAPRRRAVATKYTADLPHPVRCTTRARRWWATRAWMAVHWSSRNRAPSPARARRWCSARSRSAASSEATGVWWVPSCVGVLMLSLLPEPRGPEPVVHRPDEERATSADLEPDKERNSAIEPHETRG